MKNKKKILYLLSLALVFIASVFVSQKKSLAGSNFTINEIMINGNEFIELYNPSENEISLTNYYLAYYSSARDWPNPYRNKRFPDDAKIGSHEYYLIVIKTGDLPEEADWNLGYSSYQLSDSNGSVAIFPNNTFSKENSLAYLSWGKVDKVGAGEELEVPGKNKSLEKKDDSGDNWHESSDTGGTPKKENSEGIHKDESGEDSTDIAFSIEKDSDIHKKIYANFECKLKSSGTYKFTWNWGDGHKSYLQKTKHKYEKSGTYSASLKVYTKEDSSIKNFTVEVEDYSAPKIKIIGFSPNPKGKDTENEWIEIKNNSKHEVNLKNWSIATGTDKLYNHPIKKDFKIKPGKSKKLKRKICAFSLGNKKSKVELRSPDGKVVQKIKYNREKNKIEEDEIYELDGKKWEWQKSAENIEKSKLKKEPLLPLGEGGRRPDEGGSNDSEANKINLEIQANLGKISVSPTWEAKKKNKIILLSYNTKIKTPESLMDNRRVLGAYSEKNIQPEKHWAVIFVDGLWKKLNFSINKLLFSL